MLASSSEQLGLEPIGHCRDRPRLGDRFAARQGSEQAEGRQGECFFVDEVRMEQLGDCPRGFADTTRDLRRCRQLAVQFVMFSPE